MSGFLSQRVKQTVLAHLRFNVENEELEASGQAVIDVIPRIHYQIIQIGGQDAHAAADISWANGANKV